MRQPTRRRVRINPEQLPACVIGLGLMGHSIIACLLSAGHPVIGLTRSRKRHRGTRRHVRLLLEQMRDEDLTTGEPARLIEKLSITENVQDIVKSCVVIESIIEDIDQKRQTYRAVEEVVRPDALIASNTSSIPVSLLQREAVHPERFVAIHWDEPAHVTRFMEIIAGERTKTRFVERARSLAVLWGKEPSVLRRDIRGFIANRISYAMFREACHLVDSGVATVEDVDRSLRNDVGWWIPFAGPFRYMDLMGVEAYYRVMKDLLPELSTSPEIPNLIRQVVESGGRGISTGRGFYQYTPAQAKRWEKLFLKFNYEIRRLAQEYPEDVGNRPAGGRMAKSHD